MAIDADRAEREPAAAPTLGPVLAARRAEADPARPARARSFADKIEFRRFARRRRGGAAARRTLPRARGADAVSGRHRRPFRLRKELRAASSRRRDRRARQRGGQDAGRRRFCRASSSPRSMRRAFRRDPASALAAAAFVALERERGGVSYPALADEAAHATTDPRRAALAAADRHDEIIRRLETERAAREEVEAKRARLPELLLYETPGSRVNSFIRTSRADDRCAVAPFRPGRRRRGRQLSRSGARSVESGRGIARRARRARDLGVPRAGAAVGVWP